MPEARSSRGKVCRWERGRHWNTGCGGNDGESDEVCAGVVSDPWAHFCPWCGRPVVVAGGARDGKAR